MRAGPAVVTWENSGPDLVFHLATGEVNLTFIAGTEVLRQLRQMLSWAAGPPKKVEELRGPPAPVHLELP
jgi:hypothetical protein